MVSDQQKVMIRAGSAVAAVVWIVLGLVGGWPYWLWVLLALLSLVGPAAAVHGVHEWKLRDVTSKPAPQPMPPQPVQAEQQVPPPPPPFAEHAVGEVPFDSAESECRLYLSCLVRWRPVQPGVQLQHRQPGAWAAEYLLGEAEPVLARTHPEDHARAQQRLANLLGEQHVDPTGRMEFHADRVAVVLAEADRSWIDAREKSRKKAQLWYQERDFERTVRSYLEQEVLASPGSALVWWLAGPRTDEKERVDEAVNKLADLRRLAGAAAVRELPDPEVFRTEVEEQHESRVDTVGEWTVSEPQMFDLFHRPVGNEDAGFALPEEWRPNARGTPGAGAAPGDRGKPSSGGTPGAGEGPPLGPREHALGLLEAQEDGPERALFASRLAQVLEAQDYGGIATEIRERFDRARPAEGETDSGGPRARGAGEQADGSAEEVRGGAASGPEHPADPMGTAGESEQSQRPEQHGARVDATGTGDGQDPDEGHTAQSPGPLAEQQAGQPAEAPLWRNNGHAAN